MKNLRVDQSSNLGALAERAAHLVIAAIMACGVIVSFGVDPASAELRPEAEKASWGFEGMIESSFNNFDANVWAIEQIGGRIYVGGRFTNVVNGPGGRSVPRYGLAAFDATTGDLLTDFTPDIRGGGVYAIEASSDGRLFVAGEFSSVEGASQTAGVAEIDPRTGALVEVFRAGLERPWSALPPSARTLRIHGDSLYIGGNFSHVASGSQRVRLSRVARVSLSTGRPDPAFNPLVSGGSIWDIALSPDGSRLYMVGYFSAVNGSTVYGDRFAAVATADGALVPNVEPFTPNLDYTGRQYSVEAVGDMVYVAGEEHLLQVLKASTLERVKVYFSGGDPAKGEWTLLGGGDFQDLEVVGDRVYASCHCWNTVLDPSTGGTLFTTLSPPPGVRIPVSSVIAIDGPTGQLIHDFKLEATGSAGSWALHGANDGCLWAGGDFSSSNGQWLRGLGRWCDENGPQTDTTRPSTPRGLRLEESVPGTITLNWKASTDDGAIAGYEVYRSIDGGIGSYVGFAQDTKFSDTTVAPNITYTYAVKAVDQAGNLSWRTNLVTVTSSDFEDTVRPSTVRGLVAKVDGSSIALNWIAATDNVAVSGYNIYRSVDGTNFDFVGTTEETSWVDDGIVDATTYFYYVRSLDTSENEGWRSNYSEVTTN